MKYLILFFILVFSGCNVSEIDDCLKNTGDIISYEVTVPHFTQIKVGRGVSVELVQSDVCAVTVVTGDNLSEGVLVTVDNGVLQLVDVNDCNLYRDYAVTKIRVSAPDISKIICGTQFSISSVGELSYSNLKLVSEDFTDNSILAVGLVDITFTGDDLSVVSNNLTTFSLDGSVSSLSVSLLAGDARVDAKSLIAQNVSVFHRGTNTVKVFPVNSLKARMYGGGDLEVYNTPGQLDVAVFNVGQVYFF